MPMLIRQEVNYADEFYIQGVRVMSMADWSELLMDIQTAPYPNDCYFAVEHCVTFKNAQELLDTLTVYIISDHEADVFLNFLGSDYEFGLLALPY